MRNQNCHKNCNFLRLCDDVRNLSGEKPVELVQKSFRTCLNLRGECINHPRLSHQGDFCCKNLLQESIRRCDLTHWRIGETLQIAHCCTCKSILRLGNSQKNFWFVKLARTPHFGLGPSFSDWSLYRMQSPLLDATPIARATGHSDAAWELKTAKLWILATGHWDAAWA